MMMMMMLFSLSLLCQFLSLFGSQGSFCVGVCKNVYWVQIFWSRSCYRTHLEVRSWFMQCQEVTPAIRRYKLLYESFEPNVFHKCCSFWPQWETRQKFMGNFAGKLQCLCSQMKGKLGKNVEAKGSLTEQLEHQILRPLGDHHEFHNALPKRQASPTSSIALCPCCHAPLCQHAFVAWVLEYVTLPLEVLMRLRRSYDSEYRVCLSKILCAYKLKRPWAKWNWVKAKNLE